MASIASQLLGEFDPYYIAQRLGYTTSYTRRVLEGDLGMSATFRDKLTEFNLSAKLRRLRRAGAPSAVAQQLMNRSWDVVNEAVVTFDQLIATTAANKGIDPYDVKRALLNADDPLDYSEYQDIANQGGSE